tara:strand:- start:9 stop:503 length:495 start_codon:yes stop_codon:yes gene_type:complete
MKMAVLTIFSLTILVSFGCQTTSRLGNPKHLPDNWYTIKSTAWQVKELSDADRATLETLKTKMAEAREGQYYNFFGNYTPAMLDEIASTTKTLDQAYLDLQYSNKAILASLTPGLDGLSETDSEREAGIAVVNNQNNRMGKDDWNRILLLDKPSMLSEYPVVDN